MENLDRRTGLERVADQLEMLSGGQLTEGKHELDPIATATGHQAGVVETLQWFIKLLTEQIADSGRFEDPRRLVDLLTRVEDTLRTTQDGSPVDASQLGALLATAEQPT